MGLRIATNIQSLVAQRNLNTNRLAQDRSLEKLSSGTRINRAGDDAAGLAISEKLKSQIRSMHQATRNANDGISLIQTAEGAMNEIGNILTRMRELSIQGASDTIGDTERGFINKEVQSLKDEINRIATSTEFNGMHLLDGSQHDLEFQIGVHNDVNQDRFHVSTAQLLSNLGALGLDNVSTATKEESQTNLSELDMAIQHMNENRATLGAMQTGSNP